MQGKTPALRKISGKTMVILHQTKAIKTQMIPMMNFPESPTEKRTNNPTFF